jgi:hypothetical protein
MRGSSKEVSSRMRRKPAVAMLSCRLREEKAKQQQQQQQQQRDH